MTLVCAHRGASAYHPDNSLVGFEAAIAMGADMVETDVRRATDGRLVLAHDPLPPGDDGRGLPGLADLVALAAGRIALDVELKEAGCEEDALALLAPRPAGLVVTSFIPEVVARLRALDPSLRLGLLVEDEDGHDALRRPDRCGADFLAPWLPLVTPEMTAHAAQARRPLAVWTVNDPAEIGRLLDDDGVAVVITDVPDVAVRLRAGRAATASGAQVGGRSLLAP